MFKVIAVVSKTYDIYDLFFLDKLTSVQLKVVECQLGVCDFRIRSSLLTTYEFLKKFT